MTIVIKEIVVRTTVEKTVRDAEKWQSEVIEKLKMTLSEEMERIMSRKELVKREEIKER